MASKFRWDSATAAGAITLAALVFIVAIRKGFRGIKAV